MQHVSSALLCGSIVCGIVSETAVGGGKRKAVRRFCATEQIHTGLPGGVVGGPRACQNQFLRGFESRRVHAPININRDFFLHKKNDLLKARERELGIYSMKIDEQREC